MSETIRATDLGIKWSRQDSNEPQKTQEKKGIQGSGGTESGTPADAGKVEALAAALLSLSPEDRLRLATLLSGQVEEQGRGRT